MSNKYESQEYKLAHGWSAKRTVVTPSKWSVYNAEGCFQFHAASLKEARSTVSGYSADFAAA